MQRSRRYATDASAARSFRSPQHQCAVDSGKNLVRTRCRWPYRRPRAPPRRTALLRPGPAPGTGTARSPRDPISTGEPADPGTRSTRACSSGSSLGTAASAARATSSSAGDVRRGAIATSSGSASPSTSTGAPARPRAARRPERRRRRSASRRARMPAPRTARSARQSSSAPPVLRRRGRPGSACPSPGQDVERVVQVAERAQQQPVVVVQVRQPREGRQRHAGAGRH